MRVFVRWSKGALAARLVRNRFGYVVRVPAGHRAGQRRGQRPRPRPALQQAPHPRPRSRRSGSPTARRRRATCAASAPSGPAAAQAGCRGGAGRCRAPAEWAAFSEPAPAPVLLPDLGWPALNRGFSGDQVIRLQQHLASADPSVALDGRFTTATEAALKAFQGARGLPPTGESDAATWQALLAVPLRPVDWTAGRQRE